MPKSIYNCVGERAGNNMWIIWGDKKEYIKTWTCYVNWTKVLSVHPV